MRRSKSNSCIRPSLVLRVCIYFLLSMTFYEIFAEKAGEKLRGPEVGARHIFLTENQEPD